MSAWQPIETAPRDGTVIDLWHHAGVMGDDSFTHWMPQPEPPETKP